MSDLICAESLAFRGKGRRVMLSARQSTTAPQLLLLRSVWTLLRDRRLARLFWLVMAVSHGPALWTAVGAAFQARFSADQFLKCATLAGALVFFVLKFRGVKFFGGGSNRRSCVAFYIVIALLHVDLMGAGQSEFAVAEYRDVVVSTLLIGQFLSQKRRCKELEHGESGRSDQPVKPFRSYRTDSGRSFPSHTWVFVGQALGMRAPPIPSTL